MENRNHSFSTSSVQDFHRLLHELTLDPEPEKRDQNRTNRTLSLEVQPLDMDFQPDGPRFYAVTRDLSKDGLGFVNAEPFSHEFVRIGIPDHSDATIIARVCYNLSVGVDQPLFMVGVHFMS